MRFVSSLNRLKSVEPCSTTLDRCAYYWRKACRASPTSKLAAPQLELLAEMKGTSVTLQQERHWF